MSGSSRWLLLAGCCVFAAPAGAEFSFSYGGYLREHLSLNLEDSPERAVPNRSGEAFGADSRAGNQYFDEVGGGGDLSMIRHSAKLDGVLDVGFAQFVGVGRIVRETRTGYEHRLQRAAKTNPLLVYDRPLTNGLVGLGVLGPALGAGPFGASTINQLRAAGELVRDGDPTSMPCAMPAGVGGPDLSCAPMGPIILAGDDFGLHGGEFTPEYNNEELRELYAQFDLGDKNHFRIGRQQVVWGETDFFRAMDIIHGYDLRWRSFLELENEELRKPLILFNYSRDIPQIGGALQLIVRPGWDKGQDIGNSLPLSGGRWAPQPLRGFDAFSLAPVNAHHNSGDENDVNYGLRLAGIFRQMNYSLNYYRGQSGDPVISRNPRIGGSAGIGRFEGAPGNGQLIVLNPGAPPGDPSIVTPERMVGDYSLGGQPAETVFPMVDTFGITLNAYSGWLDGVLRSEVAFIPKQPYNAGKNTWVDLGAFLLGYDDGHAGTPIDPDPIPAGAMTLGTPNSVLFGSDNQVFYDTTATGGGPPVAFVPGDIPGSNAAGCWACVYFPGLREIKEKPTLKLMLGFDKNLNWTRGWLGTQRPSFWTAQVFDTWILNFDKDDQLLEVPGYAATRREHTTYITNAVTLNYKYDTILPGIAFGFDAGSLDAFLLPFVDFVYGNHWRLRVEANIFLPRNSRTQLGGVQDSNTRALGTLANHDQLAMRLTYQF